MKKTDQIRNQIRAIERQIALGKFKNIYATQNKLKTLKMRLEQAKQYEFLAQ
jgi:hypothetical protein